MNKSRISESQIIYAIGQVKQGERVKDVSRKLGIINATFYNWKKKYGSMGIAQLRKLKQLEEKNRKLKRVVVDLSQVGRWSEW